MTPEREQELRTEIRAVVAKQLGVSVTKAADAAKVVDDLKADSLDTIELTIAIEERFSINITDAEAQVLRTVGDIIACVIGKIKELEGNDTPPTGVPA